MVARRPAGYTERSPSEAIRAEEQQIPGYTPCTQCEAKHLAEADATYAKQRVSR